MAGMVPPIPFSPMNFFSVKPYSISPIIPIPQPSRSRDPHSLNFFPPSRFQHLIQIQTHTNIKIPGHQRQRCIPCFIKSPRCDADRINCRSTVFRFLNCIIGAAGICDHHQIRSFRTFTKPLYKLLFILRDRVNANFHVRAPSSRYKSQSRTPLLHRQYRPLVYRRSWRIDRNSSYLRAIQQKRSLVY